MMGIVERLDLGFPATSIELIGDLWDDPRRLVAISESDGVTASYVEVNPASTRILGYTREEIHAMRPGDLVDDPAAVGPSSQSLPRAVRSA
jgi:hypothetical protein